MRIRQLDLTRYGKFTNHQIDFGPAIPGQPDLHILFGPNEAGKSTIFAGWLDLLFGIPERSPYGFAHKAAMQIGATLDLPGGAQQLIRVKSRGSSLRDAGGAILPEAAMAAARGELSRDSYRAMFSLDDQTLVDGGEGILASQGELGQLLFAAGAGLADLAPQLARMRDAADKVYRAGGRSGLIYDLKKRLDEVDEARRKIDTGAADYAKLEAGLDRATAEWDRLEAERAAVVAALAGVTQQLAALPFAQNRARDLAALAPLAALPAVPASWPAEAASLVQAQVGLQFQAEQTALAIGRLEAKLAGLGDDPLILGQTVALAATAELLAEHDAGLADLPNRQAEAAELARDMAGLLARLGQSEAAVAAVVLPAAVTARLRALIASRSGLATQVVSARREVQAASTQAAHLRGGLADGPLDPAAVAVLASIIAGLRARDPLAGQRHALQDRDRAAAALAPLLAALQPYRGGAGALLQMSCPTPRQVDDWIRAGDDLAQAWAGAEARLALIRKELLPDPVAADGPDPLAQAATSRTVRERLWATHRASLTAQSADAFEAALRADDQLTDLRSLAGATRIEAARLAGVQARLVADLALAEADQARLLAGRTALADTVTAAVAALSPDLPATMSAAALRNWLAARELALTAAFTLQAAETGVLRVQAEVDAAGVTLAAALHGVGYLHQAPLEVMTAQAAQILESASQRHAATRALVDAEQAVVLRQADMTGAEAAVVEWQTDLRAACAGTWLQDEPLDDAHKLAEQVDLVETLAQTQRDGVKLHDRIGKISANIAAFEAAVLAHAGELGLPPAPARGLWSSLQLRLRLAENAERDRKEASADWAEAQDRAAALAVAYDVNAQRITHMAGHFGVTGPGALLAAITAAEAREALVRAISDAEAQIGLAMGGRPVALETFAALDRITLTASRDALAAQAEVLTEAASIAFADVAEARRRIAAVGGDDAVARLDEARQTILLDIADLAQTHLRRRLGLMAMDVALKRWRETHRGAMMARASEAFALITRGEYTGFSTQTEKDRETLVALPRAGGSLVAADLSKGTRMQLYLALRIAGYDVLAEHRPPVPFIADDILETFDDDRSAETFTLLGQMAGRGQVIYLTHHAHLCEIAHRVCPGVRVHRIG